MEDKPTSQEKPFYFERQFNTKQTLVIDLSIESGDEDAVSSTGEQGNKFAVLWVSLKKLKSSIPIVQQEEGQQFGKIIKLEKPPISYGTSKYGPRLRGFYHAFQVTFKELGSIIQVSHIGFKPTKQGEEKDLFTITTFEFFEVKNHQKGYGRYVLSTRLWLTIEAEEIEKCNIKFKQYDTSFKLVQALVDQELP
jgi:hypothetical protein